MSDLFTRRVRTIALALAASITAACSDDNNPAGPQPAADTCANATGVISADITANCTLLSSKTYVLQGYRKVTNGATLTIQAGTKITGPTTGPSALFITRGAKIDAQGTAAAPIVFTSAQAVGSRRPGDWGGLIIIGNAPTNRVGPVNTEGPAPENYGQGTNATDNSGTLKYVRTEFAGYAEIVNEELNSFTFYAVGSGTTLDFLQSVAGLDDSFEWFGGTVDAKHLVSYESGDDHFDWTEGYRGRNQFLIAYQSRRLAPVPPGTLSSDPQGFEGDGCELGPPQKCAAEGYFSKPYSMPVFANFTAIGTGTLVSGYPSGGGIGIRVRRGTGGFFVNGIVARWPNKGFNLRDAATDSLRKIDSLVMKNVLFAQNTANFDPEGNATELGWPSKFVVTGSGIVQDGGTAGSHFVALPADTNNTSAASFDWTPSATSASRNGGLATFTGTLAARAGAAVTGTAYMGAADPNGPKWWQGWTTYVVR